MGEGVLRIPSMKGRVTPAEWQARVDLAACYRLVDLYGMSDMMANHISSRVPGEEDAFLINAYGMMYEEITASSLIKVDLDGNILSKPDFGALDYGINKAGYVIHSAMHRRAPRSACVIHTHSWASHGGLGARLRAPADHADGDALPQDRLPRVRGRGAGRRREGVAAARPRRRRGADPAQPRRARRRQDGRRGVQLDAPPRARLPLAARRHGGNTKLRGAAEACCRRPGRTTSPARAGPTA